MTPPALSSCPNVRSFLKKRLRCCESSILYHWVHRLSISPDRHYASPVAPGLTLRCHHHRAQAPCSRIQGRCRFRSVARVEERKPARAGLPLTLAPLLLPLPVSPLLSMPAFSLIHTVLFLSHTLSACVLIFSLARFSHTLCLCPRSPWGFSFSLSRSLALSLSRL